MEQHDGQIEIHQNTINFLKSGYYELMLLAYEPKYVSLSNGKEICMLGLSRYITTVYIPN